MTSSNKPQNRSDAIIITIAITIIGVIIAIVAWLAPFNPIGQSPLKFLIETPTSPPFPCKPLLLSEDFDSTTTNYIYLDGQKAVIQNGRLRFVVDSALTGKAFQLFGQYEQFTIEFSVFPVGEIFDASINILFLQHESGGYEYQIRLRNHQFQFLRVVKQKGQEDNLEGSVGWTQNPAIDFGFDSALIRLEVQTGVFTLWVNNQMVYSYQDSNPYLRGEVYLGAGAGEVAPVTLEIDNVRICGR